MKLSSNAQASGLISLLFLLAGVFVFLLPVTAFAAEEFSLRQAIDLGFKNNPEYDSAVNTQQAVEQQFHQTRELYLPSLDLQADGGYESTDSPLINDQELYRRRVSLTLTQLLFNGFKTVNEVKRQQARVSSAEFRSLRAAESVALNIVNGYLNVMRYRALADEAQKNIAAHVAILNKIQDGADRGRFNLGDLAQIKSRVARAKANFESVQQNLTEAESAYAHAVGSAPEKNMALPVFEDGLLPATVDELVARALQVSPVIAILDADTKAADSAYEAKKSTRLPEVSLQLSGSKGDNLGGIEGVETSGSALMVMRWNLFRGGADQARVKEALYQKAASDDDRRNGLRTLENDIRDTWAAKVSTENQVKEFDRQIKANIKVVEAYEDQFKLSRRSLLDLLDGRSELFVSRSNYINGTYSSLFAGYRLLALEGSLVKTLESPKVAAHVIPVVGKDDKKMPARIETGRLKTKMAFLPMNMTGLGSPAPEQRYVQLGAFRDKVSMAENLWTEISSANADLLEGLGKRIQRVDLSDEGVYYRLQAGPLTLREGQDLCARLNERQTGGCFIVKR